MQSRVGRTEQDDDVYISSRPGLETAEDYDDIKHSFLGKQA